MAKNCEMCTQCEYQYRLKVIQEDIGMNPDDNEDNYEQYICYDVQPFLTPDDVIEAIDYQQMSSELWHVVDELPDSYRKIIKLHYKEEMSFNEVSDALGMPYETVRNHRDKALRRLRNDKTIRRMAPSISSDTAYSKGIKWSGLSSFRASGYSSTERIVLEHMDQYE